MQSLCFKDNKWTGNSQIFRDFSKFDKFIIYSLNPHV